MFPSQLKPTELQITGNQFNISGKTFPFQTTIPKSVASLQISKTGTYPVYFTTYTTTGTIILKK